VALPSFFLACLRCATLLVLAVSAATPASAFDRAALNRWLALDYAAPRYQALADTTARMKESAAALCAKPDDAGLAQLRSDFGAAMDAWMAVQVLRFGPIMQTQRIDRLYFWPDKHNTATKQYAAAMTAQDPALIAAVASGSASAALQGLPTIERLLYTDDAPLIGDDAGAAYRCKLAAAAAGNVAGIAEETQREWGDANSDFAKTILEAGAANASFADPRDATAAFVNGFLTAIELIADLKLARPLGLDATSTNPRLAESWRSGRSLQNIIVNLQSLRAMYDGDGPGKPGLSVGLSESVESHIAAPLIDDAFDRALAAASSVTLPLDKAVADPTEREKLISLRDAIRDVKRLAAAHLPGALDVAIGFNSLDGD
jgi:predicted lipoprotein